MKTFSFTCGILLCSKVRDFLKKCAFMGMSIEWIEGSGWIERDFLIKGSETDIDKIKKSIYQWVKENNIENVGE